MKKNLLLIPIIGLLMSCSSETKEQDTSSSEPNVKQIEILNSSVKNWTTQLKNLKRK